MSKYNSQWIERNTYYERMEGTDPNHPYPHYVQYERPVVVCLIGSSRFKKELEEANARLTLDGKIVLSLGMFGHHTPGFDMNGPVKAMLNKLHYRKIDLADEVYIVNPKLPRCLTCKMWHNTLRFLRSSYSKCTCQANMQVEHSPYIGEDTGKELAYAIAHHKTIYYLEPMP